MTVVLPSHSLRILKDPDEVGVTISQEKRNEAVFGISFLLQDDPDNLPVNFGHPFNIRRLMEKDKTIAGGKERELS